MVANWWKCGKSELAAAVRAPGAVLVSQTWRVVGNGGSRSAR